MDFDTAKRTADADEASLSEAQFDLLNTRLGQLLEQANSHDCAAERSTDTRAFVIVLQMDAQGNIVDTWRHGESMLAHCMQRFFANKRALSPPPRAPFLMSADITLTD